MCLKAFLRPKIMKLCCRQCRTVSVQRCMHFWWAFLIISWTERSFACRIIECLVASGIGECLSRPRTRIRLPSMNREYASKVSFLSNALLVVKRLKVSGKIVSCDCSYKRIFAISRSSILKSRFRFWWRMSLNCTTRAVARIRRSQSEKLETSMVGSLFALVEMFSCFTIALVWRIVLSTFSAVVLSLSAVVKSGW